MFEHDPLSSPRSIRLIKLLAAGSKQLPLAVILYEVCLDEAVGADSYEALSYLWGTPEGSLPLSCNGEQLLITPNCDSALRHLRQTDSSRTLWVDAICIDQRKTNEGYEDRGIQVPLMGKIYSKASRTLCWLGEGEAFTGDVMGHLRKIGECPSHRGLSKLMDLEGRLRRERSLTEDASCLDHIFCHPWHSRVWTVQEVAFSGRCDMICGDHSLSWDVYAKAAKFLVYDQFIETLDLRASKSLVAIDLRTTLRNYLLGSPVAGTGVEGDADSDARDAQDKKVVFLTSCMTDANQLGATNAVDKIYGFYAMYTALGVPLPAVDYRQSIVQVYESAAVALIRWSGTLKVLRDACTPKRRRDLPSWVPDWDDKEARMYMPEGFATDLSRVADASPSALNPVPGELHGRGKIVAQVHGGADQPERGAFPTRPSDCELSIFSAKMLPILDDSNYLRLLVDQVRYFRTMLSLVANDADAPPRQTPAEVFYELICAGEDSLDGEEFQVLTDLFRYQGRDPDLERAEEMAEGWRLADVGNAAAWSDEIRACAAVVAHLLTSCSADSSLPDLLKTACSNMADKKLVHVRVNQSGAVSWGTTFRAASEEDEIALLEGADWPVVMRRAGSSWRFIGPAFVVGMMKGESWADEEGEVGDLRDFILR